MAKIGQGCAQSATSVDDVLSGHNGPPARVPGTLFDTQTRLKTARCGLVALAMLILSLPLPAAAQQRQADTPVLTFAPEDLCGPVARTAVRSDVILADFTAETDPAVSKSDTQALSLASVLAAPDPLAHADDPGKSREHAALLALVPRSAATHIAIAPGSWSAPTTWHDGRVPGPDAKVLIPEGITVLYDQQSDVRLFTLRVDGDLRFATDRDTRIILDTLVVAPSGRLEIGTASDPVQPDVMAEVFIKGTGNIDLAWDPTLLSPGVISHGSAEIHGAEKTTFLKVATAPKRGDPEVTLAASPLGWRVGDRLVVTGTFKQGWAWDNEAQATLYHESQDEVVTITAIDGPRITLDHSLRYNHYAPRKDLAAYVANTTRNILFASLDRDATPLSQRGHVMFMHSDAVDVRYAAFDHLGRTDKSAEASDFAALGHVDPTSNIKGRYPLHLHKTGMASPDAPAMVVGNSVFDSPGWGYAQHSSNADFIDNVAFDVFGAAFAAEDGDETGLWLRNIAIRAEGFDWGEVPAKSGLDRHDNGRTGDGFFFAGRLVEAAENVAANTTHGFVWMHRSAPSGPMAATIDHPEVAYGKPQMEPDDTPIQGFRHNEAFGTEIGLMVIKQNSEQDHDVRSVMNGFLNWETRVGVDISYTGHYTFLDFDLTATAGKGFFAPEVGVFFGANAFDIVLNRMTIQGFPAGINMKQGYTFPVPDSDVGFVLIDVKMGDVADELQGYSPAKHVLLTAADLGGGGVTGVQQAVSIGPNDDLVLTTEKHDSIGVTPRQKAGDPQMIPRWEVPALLAATGYVTAPDGRKLALIPDFLADRATGALIKQSFVVDLNYSDAELQSLGAANHGTYDARNAAPVGGPDTAQAIVNQPILLNVLANDTDPEADTLSVQGFTDPAHGDVIQQVGGRLMYRPNLGYAGDDSFTYWVADGAGNYSPTTVQLTVVGH
jgi:G8 domain/Bacterial Ig domain